MLLYYLFSSIGELLGNGSYNIKHNLIHYNVDFPKSAEKRRNGTMPERLSTLRSAYRIHDTKA